MKTGPGHVLLHDRDRLCTQIRREVDQIIDREALSIERRRPGRKRLRRGRLLAGYRRRRNRPLLDWPNRLTSHAVEDIGERLLRHLDDRPDPPAVDGDVPKNRRRRVVVVEEIVMDRLKMPDAPAGHRVQADDAARVQVVAGAVAAVHVVGRARRRQVDVPELVVGGHRRPDIAGTDVAQRVALPRLRRGIVFGRDRAEAPAQAAGAHIEGAHLADVTLRLAGGVLVRHRLADEHQVADDQRRRIPQELVARTERGEIDAAVRAEARDGDAGLRIERVQILTVVAEDAGLGPLAPERHRAQGAAKPGVAALFSGRRLRPDRAAGRRIECLDETDGVGGVQDAAHHDRRRSVVVRETQLGIRREEFRGHLRPPPRDAQPRHVRAVDLIERRILLRAVVARVVPPLARRGLSLCPRLDSRCDRENESDRHHGGYGKYQR